MIQYATVACCNEMSGAIEGHGGANAYGQNGTGHHTNTAAPRAPLINSPLPASQDTTTCGRVTARGSNLILPHVVQLQVTT
jgi:hypothetical protein